VLSSATKPATLITLLTDFGTADYYVAAVKGVILSRSPGAQIVDVTHDIEPQNVLSAAYVLLGAYDQFPQGTIHMAVVDPGVGSARRGLVVRTSHYYFVGPDNGLFSLVTPKSAEAFEIQPSSYLVTEISNTFHGRDIFAPVAAALSAGTKVDDLAIPVGQIKRLPPLTEATGLEIHSRIIHIDRFGNGITGIPRHDLDSDTLPVGFSLRVGDKRIEKQKRFYAEDPVGLSQPFLIWGSLGFLEISATDGSAAELLGLSCGQDVTLILG
jgi:S-adenosyl-L-methionine hydrolase (adenosine-forming)